MNDTYVEQLFDALTGYTCTSRSDISDVTGWPISTVDAVLHHVRKPHIAADWGWTVPHVPRGHGEHLFQIVEAGTTRLDDAEYVHVKNGAVSTLRVMASHGENEGQALRLTAQHLSPAHSRLLLQTVTASEGAAAMARQAADMLAASNGTP